MSAAAKTKRRPKRVPAIDPVPARAARELGVGGHRVIAKLAAAGFQVVEANAIAKLTAESKRYQDLAVEAAERCLTRSTQMEALRDEHARNTQALRDRVAVLEHAAVVAAEVVEIKAENERLRAALRELGRDG